MFWSVLFIINLQLDSLASISVNDFHNVLLAKKVQEVIEQIEVICIVLFTIYEYTAVNKNYLWFNTKEKKQKWVPADIDFIACFLSNRRFFRWNHCMLRLLFCVVMLLVSSAQPQTNHNNDRNMKISKTKTPNVQHTFWHIFLPSLSD